MRKCHSKIKLRSDNVCTSTNRETENDTSYKKYQKWKRNIKHVNRLKKKSTNTVLLVITLWAQEQSKGGVPRANTSCRCWYKSEQLQAITTFESTVFRDEICAGNPPTTPFSACVPPSGGNSAQQMTLTGHLVRSVKGQLRQTV